MFFGFKKHSENSDIGKYDTQNKTPIIRASICTGEKVAGFKDKTTGKFQELMLIRNSSDLEKFKKLYNISKIETEY